MEAIRLRLLLAANLGLLLAGLTGVWMWRGTSVQHLETVPMAQRSARVRLAPPPSISTSTTSSSTTTSTSKAAWRGGGVVACDLSDALPDGEGLHLSIGTPLHASMAAHLDISTWDSGARWPVVRLSAASVDGEAQIFVRSPDANEVITVAWTAADTDARCEVTARQPTRPVSVHVQTADSWWRPPEVLAVVGCGQTHLIKHEPTVQVYAAEPCAVHTWRTTVLTSARSEAVMIDPHSDEHVQLPVPPFPLTPDLDTIDIAIDAAAFEGSHRVQDVLVDAADALDGIASADPSLVQDLLQALERAWSEP